MVAMQINSEQILDQWLVLGAQNGDVEALDQLLKRWYPRLLRYSENQLSNHSDAKDVVQEALLVAAKTIGRLRDPASFPRWLYQILHRRGIDHLRKQGRQHLVDVDPAATMAAPEPTLDAGTRIDIQRALSCLSRAANLLVHLYYLEGFTIAEISNVVGIPTGTVKSRLHAARRRLTQQLEIDHD